MEYGVSSIEIVANIDFFQKLAGGTEESSAYDFM